MRVNTQNAPFSSMIQFELCLLSCCLFIGGLYAWQVPTAGDIQHSLESCQVTGAGEHAARWRCLMARLGLWTDEFGYNARRIAKVFAAYKHMEELQLVIDYCNSRERREEQPAEWAFEAYKCATVGRFGKWIKDYYAKQQQAVKVKTFHFVKTKFN